MKLINVLCKMSKQSKPSLNKLKKTASKDIQESITKEFSPRKTRQHIKLKYDEDTIVAPPVDKPVKSSMFKKEIGEISKEKFPITKTINKRKLEKSNNILKSDTKIKLDELPVSDTIENISATTSTTASASKSDNATDIKQIKWEPKNWQKTLENIRKMRQDEEAPVDTMGCHKCSDEQADEKTKRYQSLVSLMLSSQTKDQINYAAMSRLKQFGLTPENIVKCNVNELEKLIYPVSFYKNKAKNIQKATQILIDNYNSDIPDNLEGLMALPGVGPKMAHLCMKTAWNIVTGIGVDTHVHRISNRLRWVKKTTKEPEQTRVALEQWLPFELWHEVNELLVGLGQTICKPTNPKCDVCLNASICPSKGVKK